MTWPFRRRCDYRDAPALTVCIIFMLNFWSLAQISLFCDNLDPQLIQKLGYHSSFSSGFKQTFSNVESRLELILRPGCCNMCSQSNAFIIEAVLACLPLKNSKDAANLTKRSFQLRAGLWYFGRASMPPCNMFQYNFAAGMDKDMILPGSWGIAGLCLWWGLCSIQNVGFLIMGTWAQTVISTGDLQWL